MSKFEIKYRAEANRLLLFILWAHLPVLTAFAAFQGSSILVAVLGSLMLCAGPTILSRIKPEGLLTSIVLACSTMGFSGLLIYLGNGRIEYHFHVFSFLAVVTAMCQPWAQLAAAATIAGHHVIGWMLVPKAVFNYDAAFGDVALHALFVILETAVCLRIVSQLSDTIRARGVLEEQVAQGASSVSTGAREIAGFVKTLANSAASQASMVDQVAAASSQLSQSWKNKEEEAQSCRTAIAQAATRVEACQKSMLAINANMGSLSEANRKVSGVMALVMDIARQTNILAINASIEASRSGAAGAGFGIIADQVRDLASRTAEAARDIESVVTESITTVERSTRGMEELSNSISFVGSASKEMEALSSSIVDMGQVQSQEIAQISSAIQKIAAETQNLAAGAEQSSVTSTEMAHLAEDLNATLASIH